MAGALVPPVRIMPRGIPIADPLTNIGATELRARPEAFSPVQTAKFLDQVNPDPIWRSRWQDSATEDPEQRPWVRGYRWWEALVPFETWEPDPLYRIDFRWRDGFMMGYSGIPHSVWFEFINWTGSVGQWYHKNILKPGWRPGMGARYPEVPI